MHLKKPAVSSKSYFFCFCSVHKWSFTHWIECSKFYFLALVHL